MGHGSGAVRRGGLGGRASGPPSGRAESAERGAARGAGQPDRARVSRRLWSIVCAMDAPGGARADRTRERGLAGPSGGRPLSAGLGFHGPAASAASHRAAGGGGPGMAGEHLSGDCPQSQGARLRNPVGRPDWPVQSGQLRPQLCSHRTHPDHPATGQALFPVNDFQPDQSGKLRFMIYQGALNTTIFLNFLHRLIREAARKLFVIVDNLAVHRAHRVTAWVQNNADRIELVYLPPPAFAGAGFMPPSTIPTNSSTMTSSRRWRAAAYHATRPRSNPV